ncbi:MAG: hypothetical protein FWF49_02350, partial [Oscillospiraceae bacterium]|nr:hypothetical protein [Oscillospiraceae bacterium]
MKGKRFFGLTPLIVALALFGIVTVGATFLFNRPLFVVEAIVGVLLLGYALWHILHLRYYIARAVQQLSLSLRHGDKEALASFPLPAAVVTPEGEVLWYNQRFKQEVAGGANLYGERASIITGNVPMAEWQKKTVFDVSYRGARYTVYVNALNARDTNLWVLYYIDDTGLKEIAEEYALSRPAVLLIQIDSVDDLMKGIRDSERAQLVGRIEALLEEWAGSTTGVLHRYSAERFSLILEHRHLQKILVSRFDILDRVRALPQPGGNSAMTLSI